MNRRRFFSILAGLAAAPYTKAVAALAPPTNRIREWITKPFVEYSQANCDLLDEKQADALRQIILTEDRAWFSLSSATGIPISYLKGEIDGPKED